MTREIKRGYALGDATAKQEAIIFQGLTWEGWKHVLENKLRDNNLNFPKNSTESVIRKWFTLRNERKNRLISEENFEREKEELFKGNDELFEDEAFRFAIKFITDRTEVLNSTSPRR